MRMAANDYGYRVRFANRTGKHYATFRCEDGTSVDHAASVAFRKKYLPNAQMTSFGITFTVRLNPDA